MSAAVPQADGAAAFPWTQAMALGLGELRLAPAAFWAMTPREFAAAIAPFQGAGSTAPTREGLAALIERFPDRRN